MHIIMMVVVGAIVGWLASVFMKTNKQMGLLANIAVGIVGSALGDWIFGLLGFYAFGTLARLVVGILGAMLLIAILRKFKIFR
jgi:uncharacterized membrane protein YeaQ/YmgE (transglycosylase-associated protein family)